MTLSGRKVALKLGHTLKKQHLHDILRENSLRYHKVEWDIYKRLNINGRASPGIPQGHSLHPVTTTVKSKCCAPQLRIAPR